MRQNLLESVTDITKCDKKLLQSVISITKFDNYCKVRNAFSRCFLVCNNALFSNTGKVITACWNMRKKIENRKDFFCDNW